MTLNVYHGRNGADARIETSATLRRKTQPGSISSY